MALTSFNIIIASVIIGVGSGAVIVIAGSDRDSLAPAAPSAPDAVHTTAWYVAHPDIAKQDEARCGNNAATISEAACQNDASAENQLLENELGNAAAVNSAASNNQNQKTQ